MAKLWNIVWQFLKILNINLPWPATLLLVIYLWEVKVDVHKNFIHRVSISAIDDTTLMAESEEELKSLLMKVKEESGKSWLNTQHSENEDHGIWSHHFMANRWGKQWKQCQTLFWGSAKSLQIVTEAMKLKDAYSLEGKLWPT